MYISGKIYVLYLGLEIKKRVHRITIDVVLIITSAFSLNQYLFICISSP